MADKRISQLVERTDIANNDVLPIVASGATTTNKVTVSTLQDWMQENLDVGVTSVGLSMPSAFTVSNSPVTTSGNISVSGAGTVSQYIRGDGSLADFPSISGGGSSVSYYLNGSVSQGTIGGIAYRELNKVPILGTGTDFVAISDGYLASFITDAGDPSLLLIPGGNWNFETYFSASSGGGTPTFYVELYKVDSGGTATLIASNSTAPELIAFGTTITPYFSTLAVPTTTLTLTDRLAIRYYIARSGRTITLHTENGHLCQIITTFTTGLTALNGLTAQVQNLATGTSGSDFNISSSGTTHTFNIPSASADNRGLVTTGSQNFAGNKSFQNTIFVNAGLRLDQNGTALPTFVQNISGTGLISSGSNGLGFNSGNNLYFSGSDKGGAVFSVNNSAVRTYTLQNANGTLAFTSDISSAVAGYLPLTGGTLTGALNGTSASFTGLVTINSDSGGSALRLIGRSAGDSSAIRFFANNNSTQNARIESNSSEFEINSISNLPLTFKTNDTTRLTLASTGAATFSSTLRATEITAAMPSGNGALYINNSSLTSKNWTFIPSTNAGETDLLFFYTGVGAGTKLTLASTGAATFSSSVTSAGNIFTTNDSVFSTAGSITRHATVGLVLRGVTAAVFDLALYSANGTAMMTNPAGSTNLNFNAGCNVGMGGTLNVTGAASFSSSVTATQGTINGLGGSRYQMLTLTGGGVSDEGLFITTTGSGNDFYAIKVATGANANAFALTNAGNVGIGTASPGQKLAVSDSGVVTRVLVENTGNAAAGAGLQMIVSSSGTTVGNGTIRTDNADNMQFFNIGGERMRITSGGYLKASNTGNYESATGAFHEIISNQADTNIIKITNTHGSSPYGPWLYHTTNKNNGANYFLVAEEGSNVRRFAFFTNGGLANYQANNTNLSDERTKKDIEPLESYWDKFKAIEIVKFKYKDQTHDDFNIGVIAQQVEAVAPEFVDVDGWGKPELDEEGNEIVSEEEPLKSIYTADLHNATIKVLQEAMAKIEKLETEIDSLKNQIK